MCKVHINTVTKFIVKSTAHQLEDTHMADYPQDCSC